MSRHQFQAIGILALVGVFCTQGAAVRTALAQAAYVGEDEDDGGWFSRGGKQSVDTSVLAPLPPIYGNFGSRLAGDSALTSPSPTPSVESARFSVDTLSPGDEDEDFQFEDLYPTNLYADMLDAIGRGPDEQVAKTLYAEGKAKFDAKEYSDALKKFEAAAERWPDSLIEEDALFHQAECEFFTDDCPEAFELYGQLLKKHSYTKHLDKVVYHTFLIGQHWEKVDRKGSLMPLGMNLTDSSRPMFDPAGNAIKAYEMIRMYDPTGPWSDDSLMASGSLRFRKERYAEAVEDFDILRLNYPDSPHQLKAHLLEIKSLQLTYQGPMYDGAPLDKAKKVAENALVQFNSQLGADRTELLTTRREIIELQAERDWTIAQFYEGKNEFGAARFHYNLLLKEFPDTVAADRARTRIEEIRGEPDTPTDHFEWLSELIDSDDSVLR